VALGSGLGRLRRADRDGAGVAGVILVWLPLIEAIPVLTPGLLIGAAAALLYLWWRLR
jgi:hypothetical protein